MSNETDDKYAHSARSLVRPSFSSWVSKVRCGEREKQAVEFYSQFGPPGSLCFDVGANIGARTALFTACGWRVVAVEPQAACAEVLDNVYGTDSGVIIVNKAVGHKTGTAEIMIGSVHQTSTMSREWQSAFLQVENPDVTWQATQTVQVTTLDELIHEFGVPRFVKIDVEGYEHAVLQGLSRSIPALSFEFHSYQLNETFACIDALARLGDVKLNFCIEEAIQYVLQDWVKPEVIKRELAILENKPPWYGNVYAKYDMSVKRLRFDPAT